MWYHKEENMNKKLLAVLVVILLAVGGLGLSRMLAPKGEEGTKEVTVQVLIASENIDFTDTYKTDTLYLEELLKEQADTLMPETEDTQFGPMLVGLMGYQADTNKEYFNIKINGEDAMVGIKEIPVNEGDVFTFEVSGF